MADGDDLVIGENNQAQSATQLVLGLGNPSTTLLRVGTGGGASIGVHGEGAIGIHGKGGTGVSGEGDIGVPEPPSLRKVSWGHRTPASA